MIRRTRFSQGFSLIEALAALCILSFVLFAVMMTLGTGLGLLREKGTEYRTCRLMERFQARLRADLDGRMTSCTVQDRVLRLIDAEAGQNLYSFADAGITRTSGSRGSAVFFQGAGLETVEFEVRPACRDDLAVLTCRLLFKDDRTPREYDYLVRLKGK